MAAHKTLEDTTTILELTSFQVSISTARETGLVFLCACRVEASPVLTVRGEWQCLPHRYDSWRFPESIYQYDLDSKILPVNIYIWLVEPMNIATHKPGECRNDPRTLSRYRSGMHERLVCPSHALLLSRLVRFLRSGGGNNLCHITITVGNSRLKIP